MYEWEGKIENDSEVLMMIKTRSSRISDLTEFVKSKTILWHKSFIQLTFCRESPL